MKVRLPTIILILFCLLAPVAAKPLMPGLLDWQSKPEQVLKSLKSQGIESELKMFHKTGVPYIKGKVTTLGNHWDLTVYFDEKDLPNQVLLQLDDVSRSAVTRVQKLAVGDFGKDYKVEHKDSETRKDTFFKWSASYALVELNSARYPNDTNVVWLQFNPRK